MSAAEVAQRLGVSRPTVYRLSEAGVIPALRVGSQWRFSAAELQDWLQACGTRGRS
jgi:excisionase family DNA binding protein